MLGSDRDDPLSGSRVGLGWIYVAVDDPDAHHDQGVGGGRGGRRRVCTTPTTGRATMRPATPRGTSGTSARTAPAPTPRPAPRPPQVIKCPDLDDEATTRRPGRPARLSRDAVVSAALQVIDREGIDALTMRRVARELDSSPMAIYRHVRDKDQLLVLMLDRLAATVAVPRFDPDPRTRLQQVCRAMRDGLARYPWVVDVLAQGDLIAPSILWLLEAIVSGFIACGLTAEQAVEGYRAVWQFTVGELIIRRGLDRTAALGRPPFVVAVLTGVDPVELPTLAAVRDKWPPTRATDSYDVGIGALIDGLIGGARAPT